MKKVPEFKSLFTDIFGGTQTRLNVKFVIEEHVYSNNIATNPEVAANTISQNNSNTYLIKINTQCLVSNGTLYENKLENAKTIAHEAIHAFLHNLLKNPNSVASITNIDQKNLTEILNALKVANSNQHDIMFAKLTSTIEKILKSLKNELTTPAQRAMVEDMMINQSQNPPQNPQLWNWNTYFRYLSYTGLHNTAGFIALFPIGSDARYNFDLYISIGRAYLNN